jgi:hypothetical protein
MMKQFSLRKKRGSDNEAGDYGDAPPGFHDEFSSAAGTSSSGSVTQQLIDDALQSHDQLGLKVLYRPPRERCADIVFVHGLGGNSRKTWTLNKDPSTFWPLQFLPHESDIQETRISSFGYNADFRGANAKSKVSILDFSKDLLYDLKYAQDESGADVCELKMGEVVMPTYKTLIGLLNNYRNPLSSSFTPWVAC